MELSSKGISSSKSIRIDTIKKLEAANNSSVNTAAVSASARLIELSLSNIEALLQTILYNESIGIRVFRITSNLFPHMGNPLVDKILGPRNIDFARDALQEVGKRARGLGHRLTFHPDHYTQLGSPRPEILERTARDLALHAKIFEYLGYTPELGSVMILHGGGVYGDKAETLKRFERNFQNLPAEVRQFICLENDEWQYSVMDLLPICERNNIPLCIDFFHHEIGHSDQFDIFDEKLLARVIRIWNSRGIRPKCHWSNQRVGARKGTHDDYIHEIPKKIMDFCTKYSVDMMCECKMKELCVQRLLDKHFTRHQVGSRIEWRLAR